jgi:hypothetical protein
LTFIVGEIDFLAAVFINFEMDAYTFSNVTDSHELSSRQYLLAMHIMLKESYEARCTEFPDEQDIEVRIHPRFPQCILIVRNGFVDPDRIYMCIWVVTPSCYYFKLGFETNSPEELYEILHGSSLLPMK